MTTCTNLESMDRHESHHFSVYWHLHVDAELLQGWQELLIHNLFASLDSRYRRQQPCRAQTDQIASKRSTRTFFPATGQQITIHFFGAVIDEQARGCATFKKGREYRSLKIGREC